jgi:hypothetical protein
VLAPCHVYAYLLGRSKTSGAYGEYVCLPASFVARKPRNLSSRRPQPFRRCRVFDFWQSLLIGRLHAQCGTLTPLSNERKRR